MTGKTEPRLVARQWHNLRTGETDTVFGEPDNLEDYLPQHTAVIEMFRFLVKSGVDKYRAFTLVGQSIIQSIQSTVDKESNDDK